MVADICSSELLTLVFIQFIQHCFKSLYTILSSIKLQQLDIVNKHQELALNPMNTTHMHAVIHTCIQTT